jgi:phosphomevalonate kinase
VVVVVVGGILTEFFRGESEVGQDKINAVSQVANIAAQNKIGSNFDISTAVYGSQLYKNVLPRRAFQAVEQKTLK